ncbi:MAG: LysR family transcriptional regulator [Steroidobacteraceae bacterium]|nr:LysR family transcriptional regulator [Steroidobacteraceae bacterium]
MSRLGIAHLAMLEAIAGSRSLQEAAGRLRITPSALSHRLREAERRLGVPLVVRGGERPRLTPAGERLLPVAARLVHELRAAENDARAAPALPAPPVRIAASTLSGYQWLPPLMRELAAAPEPVELEVALDVSLDPLGAVRDGRADLAVVPTAVGAAGLGAVPRFGDEMVAGLPANHPKAARPWLAPRDFLDETYVADATRPEPGREVERFFAPAGVEPSRVLRAGATEGVLALVGAGFGVTILTRLTVEPYRGLAAFEQVPLGRRGLRIQWHAVLRRSDAPLSRVGRVARALAAVTPALAPAARGTPRSTARTP